MQLRQPAVPSRVEDRCAVCQFCHQLLGGLVSREGGCVKPPADIAELALHACLKSLVPVELELLLWVAGGIALLAHLDPRIEDDKPYRTRRHELEEEVQLGAIRQHSVQ